MLQDMPLTLEEHLVKASELKEMSIKQLRDLIAKAEEALEAKTAEEIQETRAKIAAMAESLGITVNELIGAKNGKSNGSGRAAIRYRDPKNPANTWSGRGRPTKWLADLMAAGKNKEDYAV